MYFVLQSTLLCPPWPVKFVCCHLTDRASAAATAPLAQYPTFLRKEAPSAACVC
jgi:hypothetical protein